MSMELNLSICDVESNQVSWSAVSHCPITLHAHCRIATKLYVEEALEPPWIWPLLRCGIVPPFLSVPLAAAFLIPLHHVAAAGPITQGSYCSGVICGRCRVACALRVCVAYLEVAKILMSVRSLWRTCPEITEFLSIDSSDWKITGCGMSRERMAGLGVAGGGHRAPAAGVCDREGGRCGQ